MVNLENDIGDNEHASFEKGYIPEVNMDVKSQMDLFSGKEKALQKELSELEVNDMTPLDALSKLSELKKKHGL